SQSALKQFMESIFGQKIEAWREAQAEGKSLEEHLEEIDLDVDAIESDVLEPPADPRGKEWAAVVAALRGGAVPDVGNNAVTRAEGMPSSDYSGSGAYNVMEIVENPAEPSGAGRTPSGVPSAVDEERSTARNRLVSGPIGYTGQSPLSPLSSPSSPSSIVRG